ncbi:hypothetical protein C4J94_5084 [Pseudomonas sp. R5-89-07]|nr:hypothetical protein C4J94_5084 [Pseudomonas sp. R5-89-07]
MQIPQGIGGQTAGKTAQVTICDCPQAVAEGKCRSFFPFLYSSPQEISDAQPS